ncbi:unnamed protein product [Timema podura]|uniref:Four-jointed box protein 1 n=1 Tax=Timema podura TaxID=61482 RepID=A0ABN7PCN1_TIMPD|nr:unnamed protein product [Timema podura]
MARGIHRYYEATVDRRRRHQASVASSLRPGRLRWSLPERVPTDRRVGLPSWTRGGFNALLLFITRPGPGNFPAIFRDPPKFPQRVLRQQVAILRSREGARSERHLLVPPEWRPGCPRDTAPRRRKSGTRWPAPCRSSRWRKAVDESTTDSSPSKTGVDLAAGTVRTRIRSKGRCSATTLHGSWGYATYHPRRSAWCVTTGRSGLTCSESWLWLGGPRSGVVVLTRFIPSLRAAHIPLSLRTSDRHLHPTDVPGGANESHAELAQWSDLVVLDYLTANLDRVVNNLYNLQWNPAMMDAPAHNLARDPSSGLLLFLDNESGLLHGYRLLDKYEHFHASLLRALCVFRRSTADVVRRLHLDGDVGEKLQLSLADNPPEVRDLLPPLPERSVKILNERIARVHEQISWCEGQYGP